MTTDDQKLFEAALQAREKAHAVYSNFKVGASLLLQDESQVVTGCNVENASFGGTICAERSSIVNAVSKLGPDIKVQKICVVVDADELSGPCGLCRQVLSEFTGDDAQVLLANLQGVQSTHRFGDLFPMAFRRFTAKS